MWLIYLVIVLVTLFYFYLRNVYSFWERKGVVTPTFHYVLGNTGSVLTLTKSIGDIHTEIYNKFKGYNYVGFYKFMVPHLVIRSPELVKDVLQTNFGSFHNNDVEIDEKTDLIFGKNPFTQKGEKWKISRNQLTPVFSASKMKALMPLLVETTEKLLKYLDNEEDATNGNGLEAKEVSYKYTCDNVASCAFGLNGRSFEVPNAEFRNAGSRLLEPSLATGIKLQLLFVAPSLSKILKVKFCPDDVMEFFRNIVKKTKKYREENNLVRKDFLDMMFDLQKKINDEKQFNLDDIVAHSGSFFIDGFETSSVAISFTLYELANHQDIQEKLREEIDHVLAAHGGKMTYEALSEMTYLECVLKENLRMHVPLAAMTKVCTKAFKLPPLMENNTGPTPTIEPGVCVNIPVHGLQMDENYFPNPTCFNPERFSEGNKEKIVKFTWLGFGEGPRMCLGRNFGMLQSKVIIVAIIANYVISVNKKTQEPIKADPKQFTLTPIGGLWLDFKKRNL